MIRMMLVKVAIGLAVSAGSVALYHAVQTDVSATPPREEPTVAPSGGPAASTARSGDGAAVVGIDEDGLRLQFGPEGRGAGVEMTGDGMQVWIEGEDGQGRRGSGGAGMDAEGMRLWLHSGS